ncbi:hypothetical protein M501DRAFT_988323 [Patellaria atrata CBS 101060]|uniref:Uncharacterized protein n=1 Tax=Patellaria atrata CBS 101060 TaxID=1346257 RepID=A0A9P4VU14_9PEZI|nr:hypothetical protein M501DRAFT_988323 [Patellaria atrata CBS 101060]
MAPPASRSKPKFVQQTQPSPSNRDGQKPITVLRPTPKFSFRASKSTEPQHHAFKAPSATQLSGPRARKLERIESIEDEGGDQSDPADELDHVLTSIERDEPLNEQQPLEIPHAHDEEEEMLFTVEKGHKRRRVLHTTTQQSVIEDEDIHNIAQEILTTRQITHHSNSIPSAANPPATPSQAFHRFVLGPSPAPWGRGQPLIQGLRNGTPTTASTPKPSFLKPSIRDSTTSTPLPDSFSPHRRGQKFVPGGMAATVGQWIVEVGHTATTQKRGSNTVNEHGLIGRIRVKSGEISPTENENTRLREINVVLVGKGRSGRNIVQEGDVVGIWAPSWDIEIKSQRWAIGVDWGLLNA